MSHLGIWLPQGGTAPSEGLLSGRSVTCIHGGDDGQRWAAASLCVVCVYALCWQTHASAQSGSCRVRQKPVATAACCRCSHASFGALGMFVSVYSAWPLRVCVVGVGGVVAGYAPCRRSRSCLLLQVRVQLPQSCGGRLHGSCVMAATHYVGRLYLFAFPALFSYHIACQH